MAVFVVSSVFCKFCFCIFIFIHPLAQLCLHLLPHFRLLPQRVRVCVHLGSQTGIKNCLHGHYLFSYWLSAVVAARAKFTNWLRCTYVCVRHGVFASPCNAQATDAL